MKLSFIIFCVTVLVAGLPAVGRAQVNSGSDGHDGAFNPTTTNTVIDMADHPDGIYQYTSINIPTYVTVTFIPNAANTPVVWLVQSSCVISGTVDVSGQSANGAGGSAGGPGGYRGGNGGSSATPGQGPGGGSPRGLCGGWGGNASFGGVGKGMVGMKANASQGQSMETFFYYPCWEVRVVVVEVLAALVVAARF